MGAKHGPSRWFESMSDAGFLFAISMCLCQLLLIFLRLLRDGFCRSVKTRRGRAKMAMRLMLALSHGAIGCISALSEVFEGIDYGIGSLECHLFLIAPELLMHFMDKKGDFDDSDDHRNPAETPKHRDLESGCTNETISN